MKVEKIYPKEFAANSYIVTCDACEGLAVVVDPRSTENRRRIEEAFAYPRSCVLLTHAHFDHVGGAAALQAMGAKIFCSEKEKALVGTRADLFDTAGIPRVPFTVDGTLRDGEILNVCGLSVRAVSTPGHTAGEMCYLIRDEGKAQETKEKAALFTGDTLFAGSVGRTDFPTGNVGALRESLKKLAALDGDYPVFPGHEEDTTLNEERQKNPFLRDA